MRVIHPDFKSSNFIIHEATIVNDMSGNHVEDLDYQIKMLKNNGEPAELMTNQWINGTQMSMLVAHPHATIKYVSDETLKSRERWFLRSDTNITKEISLLSQSSQRMNDESMDQCIDGSEDRL